MIMTSNDAICLLTQTHYVTLFMVSDWLIMIMTSYDVCSIFADSDLVCETVHCLI